MRKSKTSNCFKNLTRLSKSCHALKEATLPPSAISSLCHNASAEMQPLLFEDLSIKIDFWDIGHAQKDHSVVSVNHAHGECQIQYVFNGKGKFKNDKNEVTLSAGQGVLIAPMCNHSWEAVGELDMLGVFIGIEGKNASTFIHSLFGEDSKALPIISSQKAAGWMADIVELLPDQSIPMRMPMIASLMRLWLMEILQDVYDFSEIILDSQRNVELTSELLCRHAESFMRANLEKPLQVEDVATHVGLSKRHLHRIFFNITGQKLHDSLIQMRLEKAYQMIIAGSPLLMKQLARECGFKSAAHFSTAFKKQFRISPKELYEITHQT